MPLDPRTPVLVGAGVALQHLEDPLAGVDAAELMTQAARAAERDAEASGLLARAQWIATPEGTWHHRDPARLVADAVGASGAHTVRTEVGILQQELLTAASEVIARGRAEVALVVGGETKFRALRAAIAGVEAPETEAPTDPDEIVAPTSLGVDDLEIVRNVVAPVTAFALIEQALAHANGESPSVHRDRLGRLWASFAQVAAANPRSWDHSDFTPDAIVSPSAGNRTISTPYTKRMSSQWNVDQAAALLLCSVEVAERLRVPRDRWVFPQSAAVANHAVAVSSRIELHRSPGAARAGRRALELAELGLEDLGPIDLYSCFPAAVQVLAAELGLPIDDPDRPLTVTGGMSFAGGPLNNYVLQALVELVERLRAAPGTRGLSTSVSGFLVKQGFGVWSTEPPRHGFRSDDVSDEVAATPAAEARPLVAQGGRATVVSWSVVHERGVPARAVAVLDLPTGARTIGAASQPALVDAMLDGDWIGRTVDVEADGTMAAT